MPESYEPFNGMAQAIESLKKSAKGLEELEPNAEISKLQNVIASLLAFTETKSEKPETLPKN